jgi:hypothetical protein
VVDLRSQEGFIEVQEEVGEAADGLVGVEIQAVLEVLVAEGALLAAAEQAEVGNFCKVFKLYLEADS